ncbi:MAG: DNA repair protein RecO [Lachnospiraceae bacterium]
MTTGMVLKAEPVGEYDRRVVLLTKNHGKIAAFARGARRQGNRLSASTDLFAFGEFKLYPGKNSYTITDAVISNYFEEFREQLNEAMYGMYFLEVMEYQTRENNDEKEMLKLLYQSLRAILHPAYDNRLVQTVFEIKTMVLMGEFHPVRENAGYQPGTIYTVDYIINQRVEQLFNFSLKEEILIELMVISREEKKRCWNHHFKSEELLSIIG